MKKKKALFLKMTIFLLLAIGVNAILNTTYNRWMYYFRLARIQDEQFSKCPDTLNYLMLGNSHNRIDPAIMGNSFCYITPKEVYVQTYYKLKYILEKTGKRPKSVILSIDPVNFSPRALSELAFDGYWRKYLDYPELAREYHDPAYLVNGFTGAFFSYAGNYRYVFMSLQFRNADMSKIRNGYIPARDYRNFAKEPNRDALGFEIATAYLSSFARLSVLGDTRYYIRILDLCKKSNIHLILIRMPLTDEYLKYAKNYADLDKLDKEIGELTKQHSSDYRILDYRHEFSGHPEFFFNADHINPDGVGIITEKLKKDISK
jgi:hypothetical protein